MKIKLKEINWHPKTESFVSLILELVSKYQLPLTVRQIHYLLVETPKASHANTSSSYQKVSRVVTEMRQAGVLDWEKIVDVSRDVYKPTSYGNVDEAITQLLQRYRRDRWQHSDNYVEVWVEKRTLVQQFYPFTSDFDIHLASGGGFSSTTYLYEARERLKVRQDEGRHIVVLYFGDLDPSGEYMSQDIQNRFADWKIRLEVKRICLNENHLKKYKLPKRFDVPVKRGNKIVNKIKEDPRAKRFAENHGGQIFQVELEALDPGILNQLLIDAIAPYVNEAQQEQVRDLERQEIRSIKRILRNRQNETQDD